MPKDKYPDEPGTTGRGEKEPLFPHRFYGKKPARYGTFGFNRLGYTSGKNEYGHTIDASSYSRYRGTFIFNEAGCKLITQAFPGFALKEILDTLNKEFEDPLSKGYSHGLLRCTFNGNSFHNIGIYSERGFGPITNSSEYLEERDKNYAIDVGKDIVDKIFEDLIPYLQRKAEENEHLVRPPPPK
jgi:hypothetical protein